MARLVLISNLIGILLFSSISLAATTTNITLLHGWNGTAWTPVLVSSTGVLQTDLNLTEAKDIFPKLDNTYNLGASTLRWKDLFVAGNAYLANASTSNKVSVGPISPASTLDVSGNLSITGSTNTSIDISTFVVDATNNRVGVGTTGPLGSLHISSGSSGATVSGNADELVIESSGSAGLSILTSNTGDGQIRFGDPQDNGAGTVNYAHSTNSFSIHVAGSNINGIDIDSNGDVGIGTVTATTKLNVSGSAAITDLVSCDTVDSTANGTLTCGIDAVGAGVQGWVASGVNLYNNTAGALIGIGTTSPTAKVEISGTGGSNNTALKLLASTNHLIFSDSTLPDTSANVWYQYMSGGSGKLHFYHNGDKLTLDNSGNIGIGTTSPGATLNITSTNNAGALDIVNGTTGRHLLFVNATTGFIGINTSSPAVYDSWASTVLTIQSSGGNGGVIELINNLNSGENALGVISFQNMAKNSADKRVAQIEADRDGANNSAALGFTVWNAGTATRALTINSSGSVGIGTTTPNIVNGVDLGIDRRYLNLKATAPNGAHINLEGSWADLTLVDSDATANQKWMLFRNENGVSTFMPLTDTGGIIANALSIKHSTGNVGINTTNPAYLFHVSGYGAKAEIESTDFDGAGLILNNSGGVSNGAGSWLIKTFNNGGDLGFLTNASLQRVTFTKEGNVGINTTSPQALLQLVNGGNKAALNITNSTGYSVLKVNSSESPGSISIGGNPSGAFITINGTGTGQTNPAIEVRNRNGDIRSLEGYIAGNDAGYNFFYNGSGSSQVQISGAHDDPTWFGQAGTDYKVGIGTTTPGNNLHVKRVAVDTTATGKFEHGSDSIVNLAIGSGYGMSVTCANSGSVYCLQMATSARTVFDINAGSGNLGIGDVRATPAADLNISEGTSCSYINAGATSFSTCSSREIKENIELFTVSNVLNKINSVQVKNFDFKDCEDSTCLNRTGFIAEEFYDAFGLGDNRHIDGQNVQNILWLGEQELIERTDQQQNQINELQRQNKQLKSELELLKLELSQLEARLK